MRGKCLSNWLSVFFLSFSFAELILALHLHPPNPWPSHFPSLICVVLPHWAQLLVSLEWGLQRHPFFFFLHAHCLPELFEACSVSIRPWSFTYLLSSFLILTAFSSLTFFLILTAWFLEGWVLDYHLPLLEWHLSAFPQDQPCFPLHY